MGTAQVENEFILGANETVPEVRYLNRVTEDVHAPCVITGLESAGDEQFDLDSVMTSPDIRLILMGDGEGSKSGDLPVAQVGDQAVVMALDAAVEVPLGFRVADQVDLSHG